MCLTRVYTKETLRRKLAEIKGDWVKVYKRVSTGTRNFEPRIKCGLLARYRAGLNKAECSITGRYDCRYMSGFHCWLATRRTYKYTYSSVIQCWVHKSWITAMGENGGKCIIASKAIFPKFPNTKAKKPTRAEAKKLLKGVA